MAIEKIALEIVDLPIENGGLTAIYG